MPVIEHSAVRTTHSLFNKNSADLILCSCDGVDFYVLKAIMAEASPIFDDMLALPQPAGNVRRGGKGDNDAHLTQMTEDACTIEHVLRFLYPVEPPDITELSEIFPVLEMSTKFMLTCVTKLTMRQYEALAKKQPLRAYALACKWRREDAIRIAAKASLAYPAPEGTLYLDEMEDISAGAYVRLNQYRDSCSAAVATLRLPAKGTCRVPWLQVDERPWFSTQSYSDRDCCFILPMTGNKKVKVSDWWIKCMSAVFGRLKTIPDHSVMISPGEIAQFLRAAPSAQWMGEQRQETEYMVAALYEFAEELSCAIEDKISKVHLEIR